MIRNILYRDNTELAAIAISEQREDHPSKKLRRNFGGGDGVIDIGSVGFMCIVLRAHALDTLYEIRVRAGRHRTPPLVCHSARGKDDQVAPRTVVGDLEVDGRSCEQIAIWATDGRTFVAYA